MVENNDSLPLVSICLITYNHEKYIKQAVDSILRQHMDFKYELLIADDASTDSTQQILRDNYGSIENVRLILRNKNTGRNGYLTYQEARGKYIYLCEGDDYCVGDESIQTLVDWLEKNDEYVGVCGRRITLSEKSGKMSIDYDKGWDNKTICLNDFLSNRVVFDICAILYRNFYQDGKYDYRYYMSKCKASDLIRGVYVLLHGNIYQIDKIVGVYRNDRIKSAGSYNVANSPEMILEDHIKLLKYMENVINKKLDYSALRKKYIAWYVFSIQSTYKFITKLPYIFRKTGIKLAVESIKMWIDRIKKY